MTGTSDKPTYPGIIPYRTNSPSSPTPAVLTNVVQKMSNGSSNHSHKHNDITMKNNNYNTLPAAVTTSNHHYQQNTKRNNIGPAITATTLYSTGKRRSSSREKEHVGAKVYTEKDLKATLRDYTMTENEVRDKYYAYWEQQKVGLEIMYELGLYIYYIAKYYLCWPK